MINQSTNNINKAVIDSKIISNSIPNLAIMPLNEQGEEYIERLSERKNVNANLNITDGEFKGGGVTDCSFTSPGISSVYDFLTSNSLIKGAGALVGVKSLNAGLKFTKKIYDATNT